MYTTVTYMVTSTHLNEYHEEEDGSGRPLHWTPRAGCSSHHPEEAKSGKLAEGKGGKPHSSTFYGGMLALVTQGR